ncbi:unnamed protein product [Eruca vesicaria subsp. sativa]|uniref:Uncharacterized protein n=1 Tax=Eruca vesicaria subsp. sativa TaxID=29727 RepID=A0ABC8IU48_ERUVS|nr:unnamed protein product [Eruca vesicaria subsp. sativa]
MIIFWTRCNQSLLSNESNTTSFGFQKSIILSKLIDLVDSRFPGPINGIPWGSKAFPRPSGPLCEALPFPGLESFFRNISSKGAQGLADFYRFLSPSECLIVKGLLWQGIENLTRSCH